MSNNESFIDEVAEEVRREKLYGYLRRYGWIGIVLVAMIVGGAAWFEWQRSRDDAAAQALGDTMLAAMESDEPAMALRTFAAAGDAEAVRLLLLAGQQEAAGDLAAARATLDGVAVLADVDPLYADLARLKSLMLATDMDAGERLGALEALSMPGAAYRMVALEQIALIQVETGDVAAARATLTAIMEDAGVSAGMRSRAEELAEALGPAPEAAASE